MPTAVPWDVKLLFDGACPLCMREVRMLSRANRKGRLKLEDISDPGFDPASYGLTRAEVMGHIHAVLPDGQVVTGMEVFRRSYAAVGLGFVLAPTAWRGIKPIADRAYAWFAKNRLRLTGRDCESGTCAVPQRSGSRIDKV